MLLVTVYDAAAASRLPKSLLLGKSWHLVQPASLWRRSRLLVTFFYYNFAAFPTSLAAFSQSKFSWFKALASSQFVGSHNESLKNQRFTYGASSDTALESAAFLSTFSALACIATLKLKRSSPKTHCWTLYHSAVYSSSTDHHGQTKTFVLNFQCIASFGEF